MKVWVLAIFLGVVVAAPFLYFAYNSYAPSEARPETIATIEFKKQPISLELEVGTIFPVKSCHIIDGYKFLLNLEGGESIEGHLPVATKEEAIPVVIELLNNTDSASPTVELLREVSDSYWIIDFNIEVEGESKQLVSLLSEKELILN